MNAVNSELRKRANRLDQTVADAINWVQDPENAKTIDFAKPALQRSLRKIKRRSEKLVRAVDRNTCVSVFGPSQAGKSFLVSVLARPVSGKLVAEFPGANNSFDYISDINPEGEGESTGLVTRFTMQQQTAPDGFPVQLELFSESDLVRTLTNSFYLDGDQSEPPPSAKSIADLLNKFRSRGGDSASGLTPEDVWEIREYTEKRFNRSAYAAALGGFWNEAAEIAPKLGRGDRAEFLSILWGGHPEIRDLYRKLTEVLDRLNHPVTVHVGTNALIPKEQSIIDVKTLHALLQGDTLGKVDVNFGEARTVSLDKPVLCALTSELVVPMQELPHPVFEHTDLLDFPGARNRFTKPLSESLKDRDETLSEIFLRGKVSYLFDRYVENQEITSMLLCVPDSNMDTLDLPILVDDWIGETMGGKASDRVGQEVTLLFVLTKMDKHLGDTAASVGDTSRFERRMHASLLERFGKQGNDWVNEWVPGAPFKNCYWLRNPNFFVEAFFEYSDDGRETLRTEKKARVAELRDGCLQAKSVAKHFADPERAWNAAMTENDGGVTYLVEALSAICNPNTRPNQISNQLKLLSERITDDLRQYYVSDKLKERKSEKEKAAFNVVDDLEVVLANGKFGSFLAALTVSAEELRREIARVPEDVSIGTGAPTNDGPPRPPRPGTNPGPRDGNAKGKRVTTIQDFQAETAMAIWMARLMEFRDLEAAGFEISKDNAASLSAELGLAAKSVEIHAKLVKLLMDANFGLTAERQSPAAAIICAETINRFVNFLGYDEVDEAERPKYEDQDGRFHPIFKKRPDPGSRIELPATQRLFARELWTDWVFALHDRYICNAAGTDFSKVNTKQNVRLRGILDSATQAIDNIGA